MASNSKRDKLLSATLQVAEALCKTAAGCGVVGIEAAGGVLVVILKQLEIVKENADACAKLIEKLDGLTTVLQGAVAMIRPSSGANPVMAARLGSEDEFKIRVDDLLAALRQVEADVLKLVAAAASKKKVAKMVGTFLSARDRKELLRNLSDTVTRAKNQFSFRNSIAIETILHDLEAKVAREAEEARLARLAQQLREEEARIAQERRDEEAQRVREDDETRREVERQEQEWKTLLEPLSRAKVDAEYSSSLNNARPPLEGTRVALLRDIYEWAKEDSAVEGQLPFYVLTGGAGTGKSAIAYAVAESAKQRRVRGEAGQLAASFFFTRGLDGLDSASTVFTTLAHQMLASLSALHPSAKQVLEEYNRLGERPKMEIQAEYLFVRLLSQLPPDHVPIVIVLDAVDECTDTDQAKRILKLMMDGLSKISSAVRIFVTSRPEVHIEYALRSSPFVAPPDSRDFVHRLQRFRLHEIPQDIVDGDIKLYFQTELRGLQVDSLFGNRSAADELTKLAAGLFIYATTMVQYLRSCAEDGSVPDLAPSVAGEHTAPKSALNKLGNLYAVILDRAPLGASDPDKSLAAIKSILGYIAVLQDHLSPNALIALSPPDLKDHIFPALRRLAPVLSFDPEKGDVPVRPLHASFVDFLLEPTSSRAEYRVWPPEQHLRLATATMGLLKDAEMVTNYISHFQKLPRIPPSVSNMESGHSKVVPNAIQYACLYWPAHVTQYLDSDILLVLAQEPNSTCISESDVQRLILDYQAVASSFFVPEHIIRWIEALGYLQCLGTATDWLPTVRRVFEDIDRSVAVMLHDAYRLVVTFHPALVEDPRHIYISALAQCPDTSPLRAGITQALAVPRSLLPYPAWSHSVTHQTEQLPIAWGKGNYRCSGIPMARYNHTDDWDRAERMEGELRPRWESHGLREDNGYNSDSWSISPEGRWGVLWATGDLLDLHSFDEVQLSFIPDTTGLAGTRTRNKTCGVWLSATSLDLQEIEKQPRRTLSHPYTVIAMEASANGSLVVLHGGRKLSPNCICFWDPTGDEICLVKEVYMCDFCLSPLGDALYLAVDATWSVIPTSHSSIAAAQPLSSIALRFSAARDTIMVATQRPADDSGLKVGILSQGFSSSSGTAGVVSRHYFGRQPFSVIAALTPDPHWMIFSDDEVVLQSTIGSSKTFHRSQHSKHEGCPTLWLYASMSPNLSRIVACGPTPYGSDDSELTFAVWDTESASLLHAFRTPRPPSRATLHDQIVVTDALDIYYVHGHRSFAYRHSDWSTSDTDAPQWLPMPEPGPVPGEWFQIGDDGWVTRSDGHPEVDIRGRDQLFWIPPSQRVDQLWRGDQHLLAMTTEYDVIVLDLSDFDDDTKVQHPQRTQISVPDEESVSKRSRRRTQASEPHSVHLPLNRRKAERKSDWCTKTKTTVQIKLCARSND
ncbi:hypothetical protein EXIGLDRAFT_753420 [Exidia glandulosa HHB12029]|uniref:Nephrocystin 3-like N-terminal domain-containing protein n=1 Tax=Exidia glandulosa HHB12029 TaxID=1314781 RepID=A0A165DRX5_EXIGL|nr:hypothetical protein EXIGLDRAFT_753420 [Exidia glandulosa HHB12029]